MGQVLISGVAAGTLASMVSGDGGLMTQGALARRLGTGDAIVLGLGSMIGAGVFAVFGPAAQAAGSGLLIGLAVAAAVAYANAAASAQLATVHPTSGGTYTYGRAQLGQWWGVAAGWAFLIGKTASCAAMALTFAAYLLPAGEWLQRPLALVAVIALAAINYRGITRTAWTARILVAFTLSCLGMVVLGIWLAPGRAEAAADLPLPGGVYGILQAAGLLFFAFAGYARIATLGEEVRDPGRTIPRAILGALAIAVIVYGLVGWAALAAAGPGRLAASATPLREAVMAAGVGWLAPVTQAGATVAALGALLTLLAGVGRTALAMARNADLPRSLAAVHPRFTTPHRADVALALVIGIVVLFLDVRAAIGFSSFGVLLYYAITHIAALTQRPAERRWPRGLNVFGVLGCTVLACTLPLSSVVAGAAVLATGVVGRRLLRRA